MSKKTLDTKQLTNELHGASAFFKRAPQESEPHSPPTEKPTSKSTQKVTRLRDNSRNRSSERSREKVREFPSRDEIQEFSFRLRDSLKVKVQAEVPHEWQGELENLARDLNVKKLELYRFIIGEFLGKVKRGT
jgi:hypothetical protein